MERGVADDARGIFAKRRTGSAHLGVGRFEVEPQEAGDVGAVPIAASRHLSAAPEPLSRPGETLGGTLTGHLLGSLHDLLEPARSPRHRAFFHSAFVGLSIAGVAMPRIEEVQAHVRAWANAHQASAERATGHAWLLPQILAILGRLAAGAVPAVMGTAYLSHLALDASTPTSLPLLHPMLA